MTDRELTLDEVLSRNPNALADLLVKLGNNDAGLAALVRGLEAASYPNPNGSEYRRPALPVAGTVHPTSEPFMVGESAAMKTVFDTIRRFARTAAPVLIQGESGTGKELAAQAIHERSAYAGGAFVAINCGGLPASLIASELFGHEKGAFTGASQRKIGKLEAANGGTLFLDEIGDMPLELQPHLLRFLQEQTIERVGSNKPIQIDCRIVAATNRDLKKLINREQFREDLFHRLNCLALTLPPLCERGDDIALLAGFFAKIFAGEIGSGERLVSDAALVAMQGYHWPGNIRELISKIRRAVVMTDSKWLSAEDLGLAMPAAREVSNPSAAGQSHKAIEIGLPSAADMLDRQHQPCAKMRTTLEEAKARIEEKLVRDALGKNAHNITVSARDLGVSRVTLYRLIEKYRIRSGPVSSSH